MYDHAGFLYNEPNGIDVYAGVPKDYVNKHITPKNFLAVLRGDAEAMSKVPGSGRVIDSGPNDRIFVYFADHGAPGMLAFPSKLVVVPTKLLARDLIATIESMHSERKFSQMLLYIEACESGSMFSGLLKPDMGVMAVTAASPTEPSYACYYNNTIGTFLGDCFSNHWLEHQDDAAGAASESIADNIESIRSATNTSHVCVYGDTSLAALPAATFLGGPASARARGESNTRGGARGGDEVSSRDVMLAVLQRQKAHLEHMILGARASPEADDVRKLERVVRMLEAAEAHVAESAAVRAITHDHGCIHHVYIYIYIYIYIYCLLELVRCV